MMENTWPIAEKLILDTLGLTTQLYQQLAQEAEILRTGQQAALLDQSTTQKKHLAVRLEGLNAQLGQLLASEQLPNTQEGINFYLHLAESAGLPSSQTRDNWQQIQQLCAECKSLNDQNGASIELLSIHAKRSLDILKGKPLAANTYGRDGVTQSESLTHTLAFYL